MITSLQTIELLDELVEAGSENMNVKDKNEVISRMKSAVASKQFGLEDVLCPLVAEVHDLLFCSILGGFCFHIF